MKAIATAIRPIWGVGGGAAEYEERHKPLKINPKLQEELKTGKCTCIHISQKAIIYE